MEEECDFDVIVVGAGVAGSVCSYLLAEKGHSVLLIDRGAEPGSKNLSGGLFYCRILEDIFPNFLSEAPIERKIVRNCLSLLNADSAVNIDYWDQRLKEPVNAVSVLRAKLDPWLAEQCENAGVTVMPGIKVEQLVKKGNRIVGVKAGEDTLTAQVVVAADGVNSFLAKEAGFRAKDPAHHLGVGVKSVIHLGEERIRERFNLTEDEGAAYAVVGDCTKGVAGGGFFYTNKESVSIGVVLMLGDMCKKELSSADIHDHFVSHPFIKPFLEDGELLEYGCHLVAEGGETMTKNLVHDGLVIIGDAAGFTLNTGFTVRGMDLAAASAQTAAQAIDEALRKGDCSAAGLEKYVQLNQESFLGQDMHTYRRAPAFLEHTPEMYGPVGQLAAQVLYDTYNLDLTARKRLLPTAFRALKRSKLSMLRLAKIGFNAVRSL